MNHKHCPYLGLREDPSTALDFPSDGNRCFQGTTPTQVKSAYQENYCLSGGHEACPLYLAARARAAPPARLAAPTALPQTDRRNPAVFVSPVVAVALLIAGFIFSRQGASTILGGLFTSNPEIVQEASILNLPKVSPNSAAQHKSGVIPQTGSDPQSESGVPCPLPEQWEPYTVNPTDSLFRLSIVHGITLEEIRRVNCLDDESVIMPGQVIYVPELASVTNTPFLPTANVFPVWTPLPQSVPVEVVQPAQQDDEDEEEAPPAAPPPPAPPVVGTEDPTQEPAPVVTEPPSNPDPGDQGGDDDKKDEDKDKDDDDDDKKDDDDDKKKDDDGGGDDGGDDDDGDKGKDKGDDGKDKGKGGGKGKDKGG